MGGNVTWELIQNTRATYNFVDKTYLCDGRSLLTYLLTGNLCTVCTQCSLRNLSVRNVCRKQTAPAVAASSNTLHPIPPHPPLSLFIFTSSHAPYDIT